MALDDVCYGYLGCAKVYREVFGTYDHKIRCFLFHLGVFNAQFLYTKVHFYLDITKEDIIFGYLNY